jgi:hypothetical protein
MRLLMIFRNLQAPSGEDPPRGRIHPPGAMSGKKGNPAAERAPPGHYPAPPLDPVPAATLPSLCRDPEPGAADPPREAGPV